MLIRVPLKRVEKVCHFFFLVTLVFLVFRLVLFILDLLMFVGFNLIYYMILMSFLGLAEAGSDAGEKRRAAVVDGEL